MALRSRNILSLCAGVGGLELGILLALHCRGEAGRGICYVEREGAAAASLVASMEAGWFHPAPVWSDLLSFDGKPWRGLVHILASGDPCQDNSVAGQRAGAEGERFLAPEVVRIADECRPDLIFRENVPGNAAEQLAALQPPLERMGYRVAAGIFSSAETGNTMRRERLFIMAERASGLRRTDGRGVARLQGEGERAPCERAVCGGNGGAGTSGLGASGALVSGNVGSPVGSGDGRNESDEGRQTLGRIALDGTGFADSPMGSAGSAGLQGRATGRRISGGRLENRAKSRQPGRTLPPAVIPGPTDSRWLDVLDRWPELQPALSQEEAESHLRRGIDAMAHRVERLRATGNGVDPLVAAYAFLSLDALLAESRAARAAVLMEQAA